MSNLYYKAQEVVSPPPFLKLRVYNNTFNVEDTFMVLINIFDIKSIIPHDKGTKIKLQDEYFVTPISLNRLERSLVIKVVVDEDSQENSNEMS